MRAATSIGILALSCAALPLLASGPGYGEAADGGMSHAGTASTEPGTVTATALFARHAAERSATPVAYTHRDLAQDTALLRRIRAHIAFKTSGGGAWWTSNESYVDEDGGQDAYWLRHSAPAGAVATTACLWGERSGDLAGVYWHMFTGPDPRNGELLAYQSSVSGIIGIGALEIADDHTVTVEQTFFAPQGEPFRVRHVERRLSPDSLDSRSFDWVDGEWQARRAYVWVRRAHASPPC